MLNCVTCSQPLPRPKCQIHEGQYADSCPYCDKCPHGKGRYEDCRECHKDDDPSWRTAPINDKELEWLREEARQYPNAHPSRGTPYGLRNYHDSPVSLWKILLDEYERLRARG